MGIFGPSRDERLAAAARLLYPYGFVFDARYAQGLRQYEPFKELAAPSGYVTACFGAIEGVRVEAYEYETVVQHASTEGASMMGTGLPPTTHESQTTEERIAVVVHLPEVQGTASFMADFAAYGTLGKVVSALLWVPPFTIAKLALAYTDSKNPDREVGDAEFDRRYKVHAASAEIARAAIPPALREVCVRTDFRGSIELRPGMLIYHPAGLRFDDVNAVHAVGIATDLIGAIHHGAPPRPA